MRIPVAPVKAGDSTYVLQDIRGDNVKYAPGRGPAVPEKCPETGSPFNMGGPFWAGPIHDAEFVAAMLTEIRVRTHLETHILGDS